MLASLSCEYRHRFFFKGDKYNLQENEPLQSGKIEIDIPPS
jgi:hypothetical protein